MVVEAALMGAAGKSTPPIFSQKLTAALLAVA
jgi:hypothetical protein